MKTSFYYRFFLAIFMFGVIAPGIVSAQTEGSWATVDTRVLLMLHPEMAGFDYANARFFRDDKLEKDINKVVADLKKAREQGEKDSAPLREQMKKLQQQRFILAQQKMRAIQQLAPGDVERLEREKIELQTALRELERKRPNDRDAEKLFRAKRTDITRRLELIQDKLSASGDLEQRQQQAEKMTKQIAAIDKKNVELAEQIAVIEDKAVAKIYLTGEETSARLKKIKDEITGLIEQAAKESQIAVVMDNSFAMRAQVRKDRFTMIPAVDEAPDIVSSSLFHSFVNLTVDPELAEHLTGPNGEPLPREHLTVGRSIGMRSNLKQYLEFRNYLPEKVADFSNGRPFLVGGTDLTPWVARKLFERYKVPEFIKNSFMQVLRDYLEIENEPETRERNY
jgi:hypothetical protein